MMYSPMAAPALGDLSGVEKMPKGMLSMEKSLFSGIVNLMKLYVCQLIDDTLIKSTRFLVGKAFLKDYHLHFGRQSLDLSQKKQQIKARIVQIFNENFNVKSQN